MLADGFTTSTVEGVGPRGEPELCSAWSPQALNPDTNIGKMNAASSSREEDRRMRRILPPPQTAE
ncbi:hypothetical protein ONO86_05606 [Micromonospora noduli]|uniref:Uncharacterized protein n=1 Tax=Micromonospora noduli TaxID=709876 RepID=A0A328N2B0_9ACTN|nr:hypothetical protein LAH08_03073 [Micromonospora noduli]RAO30054.1 hypothetical protein ONO86_05606 [Micromonospora noduli]